jgi:hypothetical protein
MVSGGPVFLFIGGEGAADPRWLTGGHMANMSVKFGAMSVLLEHRFYGQSHPTPSLDRRDLQYLNSNQALADLAAFRSRLEMLFGQSRVPMINCSDKRLTGGGCHGQADQVRK